MKKSLYRSSNQGWLGGVCAGVAEYYDQPVWMIRLLMVTLFVFSGSLGVLVYLAGVFLLEKQPTHLTSASPIRSPFTNTDTPLQRARTLTERVAKLDKRIQDMERYVTSSRYRFDKEFNKL